MDGRLVQYVCCLHSIAVFSDVLSDNTVSYSCYHCSIGEWSYNIWGLGVSGMNELHVKCLFISPRCIHEDTVVTSLQFISLSFLHSAQCLTTCIAFVIWIWTNQQLDKLLLYIENFLKFGVANCFSLKCTTIETWKDGSRLWQ